MKTFTDNANRLWTIAINVSTIKRVKDLLNVNLTAVADGDDSGNALNARLKTDYEMICNVLFCLVKPEADVLGITDEMFGAALGGDALGNAQNALVEELVNFFPNPSMRRVVMKQMEKLDQMQEMAYEHIVKQIESPQIEEAMKRTLDEATKRAYARLAASETILGSLSGNSPASLG